MALLAAESLDLRDRKPGDPQIRQSLPDFIKLERFDDRDNLFHLSLSFFGMQTN